MAIKRTKFTINTDDLHVDDLIVRTRIKSFFRNEQKRRLEYDKDVAKRVDRGSNWLHSTWRNEHWLLETIQLVARAFDYTLGVEPMMDHGAWLNLDKEGMWRLSDLYANHPSAVQREEALRMDLCNLAGKIREARGIAPVDFAQKLGTDTSKLLDWEEGNRPHYTMTSVQRHFRMLGAPLRFYLTGDLVASVDGADAKLGFEFPPCKEEGPVAAAWLMRNEVNIVETGDEVMIFNSLRPDEVVRFPAAAWRDWVSA